MVGRVLTDPGACEGLQGPRRMIGRCLNSYRGFETEIDFKVLTPILINKFYLNSISSVSHNLNFQLQL